METATPDLPAEQQPLQITVTDAGRESLVLRTLVRQAIPMLKDPFAFRPTERQHLAQTLDKALKGQALPEAEAIPFHPTDADAPPEPEDGDDYEPGCLPELPEEVWP